MRKNQVTRHGGEQAIDLETSTPCPRRFLAALVLAARRSRASWWQTAPEAGENAG